MTSLTQVLEMPTKPVMAIALEKERKAWSDEPYTVIPVAFVLVDEDDDAGERVVITREVYDALAEAATAETFRDGDYYSFERPICWDDVMPEGRVS